MRYFTLACTFLLCLFSNISAFAKAEHTYKPLLPALTSKVAAKKSLRGSSEITSKFHRKSKRSLSASKGTRKYAAIVMDADSGAVLHTEFADDHRFPASLTKMMTLYIAFEALREGRICLETPMKVSQRAALQPPTKIALRPGETITLKNAILALVTKSANDVAVVVAEHFSGSVEAFATKMTRKARALGMTKTTFKNPHGLPHPGQVSSARDLAILSMALYHHFPNQYKYFATPSFTHKGVVHRNHNQLLGRVEGVDGIKTGLTNASGFNLAASAIRYDAQDRPRRLITVVMGGPNRHWRDNRVEELFDRYFPLMGNVKNPPGKKQLPYSQQTLKTVNYEEKENIEDTDFINNLIYETEKQGKMRGGQEGDLYKETVLENEPLDQMLNDVQSESPKQGSMSQVSSVRKKGPQKRSPFTSTLTPINWHSITPPPAKISLKKKKTQKKEALKKNLPKKTLRKYNKSTPV